jgi:predicted ArsR family transcriptional regulator
MPEVSLSATSLRILKVLIGSPPLTVPDVMKALGVTRTAVVDQFRELIASGFVERITAPPEKRRGRPRHLYSATPAAMLLLFVDAQRIVLPVIWDAVNAVCGPKLANEVHRRVAAAIVEHYRPFVTDHTPAGRARQLVKRLAEEGHLVEMSQDGPDRLVVRNRSCGFLSMCDDTRTACGIHLSGISGLLRTRLRMTASRHDGAPCCRFEIQLNGQSTPAANIPLPQPGEFPFSVHWNGEVAATGSNGHSGPRSGKPGGSSGQSADPSAT